MPNATVRGTEQRTVALSTLDRHVFTNQELKYLEDYEDLPDRIYRCQMNNSISEKLEAIRERTSETPSDYYEMNWFRGGRVRTFQCTLEDKQNIDEQGHNQRLEEIVRDATENWTEEEEYLLEEDEEDLEELRSGNLQSFEERIMELEETYPWYPKRSPTADYPEFKNSPCSTLFKYKIMKRAQSNFWYKTMSNKERKKLIWRSRQAELRREKNDQKARRHIRKKVEKKLVKLVRSIEPWGVSWGNPDDILKTMKEFHAPWKIKAWMQYHSPRVIMEPGDEEQAIIPRCSTPKSKKKTNKCEGWLSDEEDDSDSSGASVVTVLSASTICVDSLNTNGDQEGK